MKMIFWPSISNDVHRVGGSGSGAPSSDRCGGLWIEWKLIGYLIENPLQLTIS